MARFSGEALAKPGSYGVEQDQPRDPSHFREHEGHGPEAVAAARPSSRAAVMFFVISPSSHRCEGVLPCGGCWGALSVETCTNRVSRYALGKRRTIPGGGYLSGETLFGVRSTSTSFSFQS